MIWMGTPDPPPALTPPPEVHTCECNACIGKVPSRPKDLRTYLPASVCCAHGCSWCRRIYWRCIIFREDGTQFGWALLETRRMAQDLAAEQRAQGRRVIIRREETPMPHGPQPMAETLSEGIGRLLKELGPKE